uniref:Fucose-specific lectin n=1 Tax=Bionectria ochroleuca TaxID=29856 RepID=A0A8H7K6M3_BIOOC
MSQYSAPSSHQYPDSSGLQVVHDSTAPEVRPDEGKILYGFYGPDAAKLASDGSTFPSDGRTITTDGRTIDGRAASFDPAAAPEAVREEPSPKSHRRMYIIIGVLVAIVVILAAVLGGVLGSRAAQSNKSSSDNSSSNSSSDQRSSTSTASTASSSPTTAPSQVAIAPKSHLAAVAWQADGSFTRFLFYQDSNGTLRQSLAAGSGSVDKAAWENPGKLTPEYSVKNNTGIAVSLLPMITSDPTVQVEMFFLNDSSVVNGINYVRSNGFNPDSVNNETFKNAIDGSDLAAYWPYVAYQSIDSVLQLIIYPWKNKDLKIRAKRGSRLALIPTSRNFTEIQDSGRWALVYQNEDGKIITLEDPANQGARKTYPDQDDSSKWWDSSFPNIVANDLASIAAFSVAASSSDASKKEINAYILYQDDSGTIQQIFRDGEKNEWQESTPDAFKGADKGTSISCATTPTWTWPTIPELGERLLEPVSDLNSCFFLKGGAVMEARLDGTSWTVTQEIKMDKFS